jgi:hypothetical protein
MGVVTDKRFLSPKHGTSLTGRSAAPYELEPRPLKAQTGWQLLLAGRLKALEKRERLQATQELPGND